MPRRTALTGHPHTYAIEVRTTLDLPLLAGDGEAEAILTEFERVRLAFDARCFAFAIAPSSLRLVLTHRAAGSDDEAGLRTRWIAAGGGDIPAERLYARLTSLSGFMQTLLQRTTRACNRRHGSRGSRWSARYRSCLLADDTATLAAIAWAERTPPGWALVSSRDQHETTPTPGRPVTLSAPPLVAGPDGELLPTGDAPTGLTPPGADERQAWLDRFCDALGPVAIAAYGEAIAHGWALGKPESLAECISRLGRVGGRGRSRSARDLTDELGLCGVWG